METPNTKIYTRLLYDALTRTPIGIAVETLSGQPLFVNPALCEMLGFSEEELLGKKCADFSPVEDAEKDSTLFEQLKSGSIDHYQIDKQYYRRDGLLVWGRLTVCLIKAANPPLVLAMVDDISERKATESRLEEYEKAVECAEEMIAVIDRDYRYLIANRKYLLAHNLERDRVVGHSVYEVLNPGEFDRVKEKVDECLSGKIVNFEIRHFFSGLGERNISASYYPIEGKHGGIDGLVGILKDITEKKRAEDALRENEELLSICVKNVPAGLAMLDREMRYIQVSDRWCADYGVDRASVLGRSHYEVYPDIPDRWKHIHRRALQGEIIRTDEDRWERQQGTLWVRWEVRPWRRADGSQGGILILAEDITRRKQMEQALFGMSLKLVESLEQERARIARELHDDINQRLALLAIRIEQLASEIAPKHSADLADLHRDVTQISSGVQSLSHQLHPPNLKYLGLAAAVRAFCRDFEAHQGIEIDLSAGDLPQTISPAVSLCAYRVLQEALHNAVKHSGVRHLEVKLGCSAQQLDLTVSDTGRGFDVHAGMNEEGLGLASMRERVRMTNGSIAIESSPGHGTTIRVRLPVAA